MRHAVNLPPFAPPETLVSLAVDAEQAGWDGVFFWDHMTWLPELRLHVHDPWVLLGAVAARTERVTWLVEGIYPESDWIDDLQASIRRGPRN
jgi:alkanesulfonate monooxygenase SsuD/methylene tetrahydromethanopterin reductase-like flavin-dependent oxidoreductase (luciferase family)